MSIKPHSLWGRAIGSYAYYPDFIRSSLSMDSELAGLQAMEKIAQLSTEARAPAQQHTVYGIEVSTLQSALQLSVDPLTIGHLANPSVINSCVQLMQTVGGRPGPPSPFSYEYGYLSFNLLVSALNSCLLERWNELDEARTLTTQVANATPQIVTSNTLASVVLTQFDVASSGGDCDWVLGWSSSPSGRHYAPLLSQSDISTLLNMLWDDRKFFLKAQSLTQSIHGSIGLAGLMFVFSRYLSRRRVSEKTPYEETLANKLNELVFRYILVASKYQREAAIRVIDTIPTDAKWTSTAKHVDADDSKLILASFINQLANENDPGILVKQDVTMMLRYVPLALDTDSQELLPEVLKWTLKYDWSVLVDMDEKVPIESFLPIAFAGLRCV
ncbi:hypothetical protein V565_192420 [Rhizoctonia solani 123E]|uniref:Uncharacterized protein n=1 Tax=Rhizoctonia solani 123E TaxID=1423351 RepID=A0A074RHG2_9AGAM|nr:hypothetical protein V565_192420 [Rhizoctonia solani 123E]